MFTISSLVLLGSEDDAGNMSHDRIVGTVGRKSSSFVFESPG